MRWRLVRSGTLKDQKLGRLTFLPLSKLKPAPLPEAGGEGYHRSLRSGCSNTSPQFEPAFRVVFGGTMVVESLEVGRRMLLGKYRMVTPEGELLEKSGAMTGGSFKKAVRGFGAAVEDEIGRLRQHAEGLKAEMGDLEGAIERSSGEIESLRAKKVGDRAAGAAAHHHVRGTGQAVRYVSPGERTDRVQPSRR